MADGNGVLGRWCHRVFGSPATAQAVPALVVFDLDYDQGRLFLVLANTGDLTALDVGVDFDRPLMGLGGSRDFAKLPVFAGLPLLRPGKEIRLFFDAGAACGAGGPFTATTRWRTARGEKHQASYRHDVAVFRDWPETIRG